MMSEILECITLAKAELQAARQKIANEISAYPTSIAGNDALFDHLLAQRFKVNAALEALNADTQMPTPRRP